MLLRTGVALFLSLLPFYAAGQLIHSDVDCAPGFEWLSTSQNQTACDVAQELGGVCVAGQFNITRLAPGNVYLGPSVESANSCRCSSVYYSLLSACAYCQQHSYVRWSAYTRNCSTTSIATFPHPIPLSVKVPRWAYQDVSTMDIFDINIANNTDKAEGPPPSTTSGTPTSSPSGGYTSGTTPDKKIAAIAATVGALVALALIGGIVAFCLMRRRRRPLKTDTKLEPVLTNFNRPPEITRPTIPGFSAPDTPFVTSGALDSTRPYHVPNTTTNSPHTGYAMSLGGTSEIYETNPTLFSNVDSQNASPANSRRYYDQQTSLSTIPVTTDNYWAQTSSSSIAHSHPATDRYYDSPVLSTLAIHQTGDSRYNDLRSTISHRQSIQSSVVSSSQTNPGTTLTSTESRANLLPPAYADIVDGASRQTPLPEKQGL